MQHINDFPMLIIMCVNKQSPTKLSTFEKFQSIFIRFSISLPAIVVKQIMQVNWSKTPHLNFLKMCTEFSAVSCDAHKQVSRYICPFLFWYASLFQLSSNTVMQSMNIALKFQLHQRTVETLRGVSSLTSPHGIWNIRTLDYHSC